MDFLYNQKLSCLIRCVEYVEKDLRYSVLKTAKLCKNCVLTNAMY